MTEATKPKRARRHGPNRDVALVARGRPYQSPNVLTDELGDKIAKAVRLGDRPFVAAEINGVPRRTHYEWIEKGEADQLDNLDTVYSQYAHKIAVAESHAEHRNVLILAAASRSRIEQGPERGSGGVFVPGDWKAALAWLSRRRDGWQDRKEITGANGTPLFGATGFEAIADDELQERLNGLRNRGGATRRAARTPAQDRDRTARGSA